MTVEPAAVAGVAQRDGRDEVCVAADKHIVADGAAELLVAVVIRRDQHRSRSSPARRRRCRRHR